jgi:hypothetical protein
MKYFANYLKKYPEEAMEESKGKSGPSDQVVDYHDSVKVKAS